jgi:hypothetical protein
VKAKRAQTGPKFSVLSEKEVKENHVASVVAARAANLIGNEQLGETLWQLGIDEVEVQEIFAEQMSAYVELQRRLAMPSAPAQGDGVQEKEVKENNVEHDGGQEKKVDKFVATEKEDGMEHNKKK